MRAAQGQGEPRRRPRIEAAALPPLLELVEPLFEEADPPGGLRVDLREVLVQVAGTVAFDGADPQGLDLHRAQGVPDLADGHLAPALQSGALLGREEGQATEALLTS